MLHVSSITRSILIIDQDCKAGKEQQGFRKNRFMMDAIFINRQTFEKFTKSINRFTILTKSFGRICLQNVLEILRKNTIPKTRKKAYIQE